MRLNNCLCVFLSVLLFLICDVSFAAASHHQNHAASTSSQNQIKTVRININTASAKLLATLKSLGKKKSQAIVDYRQHHGRFKRLADLTNVKGISNKLIQNLLKTYPHGLLLK